MKLPGLTVLAALLTFWGCMSNRPPGAEKTPGRSTVSDRTDQATTENDYPAMLNSGRLQWQKSSKVNDNTYWYVRRQGGAGGFWSETLVWVKQGRPVMRSFHGGFKGYQGHIPAELQSYHEEGPYLGRHDHGHAPLTMHDLYHKCTELLTAKPEGSSTKPHSSFAGQRGLQVSTDGVLTACYHSYPGCGGVCTASYGVVRFGFGALPAEELKRFK